MRNKGDNHQNCTLSTISMSVESKQQVHSHKGRVELKTNSPLIQDIQTEKGPQYKISSNELEKC